MKTKAATPPCSCHQLPEANTVTTHTKRFAALITATFLGSATCGGEPEPEAEAASPLQVHMSLRSREPSSPVTVPQDDGERTLLSVEGTSYIDVTVSNQSGKTWNVSSHHLKLFVRDSDGDAVPLTKHGSLLWAPFPQDKRVGQPLEPGKSLPTKTFCLNRCFDLSLGGEYTVIASVAAREDGQMLEAAVYKSPPLGFELVEPEVFNTLVEREKRLQSELERIKSRRELEGRNTDD